MKYLPLFLLVIACGKDPIKQSPAPMAVQSPYICKSNEECLNYCEEERLECYAVCESANSGNALAGRNCKTLNCDNNANSCLNEKIE